MTQMELNSIFLLYNLLTNGKYQKKQILEKLNIKKSTLVKCLYRLRKAGINISRYKKEYSILEFQNRTYFDNQEKTILAYLLNISHKYLSKNKTQNYKELTKKILTLAYKEDYQEVIKKYKLIRKHDLKNLYKEKIENLKKYIFKKTPITITLRSNREIDIIPLEINYNKDKISLYYQNYLTAEYSSIMLDKIVKIIPIDDFNEIQLNNEVIYELYGRLANTYLLKKYERVIDSKKDTLVIASSEKNKSALFKRLLRYDTLCKVVQPQCEVEKFKNMIAKSLENLNSETMEKE